MSEDRKRRKVYLVDADAPFVVPRSTSWYSQQRTTPPSTSTAQPAAQPLTDTADTEDDDAAGTADQQDIATAPGAGDGVLPNLGEEPRVGSESGSTSDTSDDEESLFGDAGSEIGCGTDHAGEGGGHTACGPVPRFSDTELLAQCVLDFGERTLPCSSTTMAQAIVLIMSFFVAHGLTWSAIDDLLKLVNALFGNKQSGLPRSK
ncbi:hypothetical protein HPB50_009682 [Hyalomma asiaticum]|uniref:Uncharacterized protein n=1 Tax=Hyalomma asiaticum TaxID=266040 RepID=A0ACB7TF51_HYAAI|nr:hypothetical protein HPB50_009682 [Hyalomma asiaticum]